MKIIFHADDFGLTSGINRGILEAVDNEVLNAVSIIPNGYAVEEAMEAYRQRNDLLLSVHLNFIEGMPLDKAAVPFLTNESGYFNRSFLSMLRMHNRLRGEERKKAQEGIKAEMKAQLLAIKSGLKPGAKLRVDSHQHVHMIPLFFDALLELGRELDIAYIRIPQDNYFISFRSARLFRQALSMNCIKVQLLNRLSRINLPKIPANIRCNDHFIGVLFTGKMDTTAVRESYRRIYEKQEENGVTEILFHPGGAIAGEEHIWQNYPALKKYYFSAGRQKEAAVLCSEEMKALATSLRNP